MGRAPISRWVCALLAVAALAGCGPSLRDKETAARAMDRFHERFNAGEYGGIYDTAGVEFRGHLERADFLQLLDTVHRKLGDYRTCDSRGWEASLLSADNLLTLRYRTTFTAGEADEEFVYAVAGTRATLRSYRIESGALNDR